MQSTSLNPGFPLFLSLSLSYTPSTSLFVTQKSKEEKRRLITIAILLLFGLPLTAIQGSMISLYALFAQRNSDMMVFSYKITSFFFQAIPPVTLIIAGGYFTSKFKDMGLQNLP